MTESSMHYPGWRVVIACFAMTFFGFGFGFYGGQIEGGHASLLCKGLSAMGSFASLLLCLSGRSQPCRTPGATATGVDLAEVRSAIRSSGNLLLPARFQ